MSNKKSAALSALMGASNAEPAPSAPEAPPVVRAVQEAPRAPQKAASTKTHRRVPVHLPAPVEDQLHQLSATTRISKSKLLQWGLDLLFRQEGLRTYEELIGRGPTAD